MVDWLINNLATIIISGLLILLCLYIIHYLRHKGGGCSGCSGNCQHNCSNTKK